METEILSKADALLEPEVLSAFVVAFVPLLTTCLSWIVNRRRHLERKQIRNDQLILLYEPLDRLLCFNPLTIPDKALEAAKLLIETQYRYVTPAIQNELSCLLRKQSVSDEDLSNLRNMVSSVYNWLRRSQGYPYDKKQICYKYLPTSVSTLYSFLDYVCWIGYVISLLLGIAAIGFTLSLIPTQIYETFAWLVVILLGGVGLYLTILLAIHMPKVLKEKSVP